VKHDNKESAINKQQLKDALLDQNDLIVTLLLRATEQSNPQTAPVKE
jgi:hypothetical protein